MRKAGLGMLTAAVLLGGCSGGEEAAEPIVIGGKPWTEQYILPHILGQYIEAHSDYEVEYEDGLGEVAILTPALEQGEIDLYVEYTGTGLKDVLKMESEAGQSSEEVLQQVRAGYEEELGATWLEPLGFENGYTLAYSKESGFEAETYSDLAAVSRSQELVFGGPHSVYEREGDGYDDLTEAYNFNFAGTESFDSAVMYEAVRSGAVDVIPAFTTDSRIGLFDLATTKDDLNFFPKYDAAPVVRLETLEEYPELEEVLNGLAGEISEEEMLGMNARVDIDKEQPQDVAHDFLIEQGLIEE
ncbi:glycine betaine ABC transporter substrate-binding protein [Planococcus lenghuensis]|uniref:Glycine/betaine ABC transporter substrate-binding protein n=1 Tax=Planococcus lenghuensis TaxID=2213202 RepID=A0A1Q2KYD5_9BACL|nr:glycine betaine ABC transporter substrate-binding protein [Planococcus lenghuensis]AQQ53199.1 glycine/betaine ABC transporter substrate-binding protein [Planococcus lenghuensis]